MEWFQLLFPNDWLLVFVRDDDQYSLLMSKIKKLELELSYMKSELLPGESVKTSCEKMDVIHEKVGSATSLTVPVKFGITWFCSLTFLKCTAISNMGIVLILQNDSVLCRVTVNFSISAWHLSTQEFMACFLQWQGFACKSWCSSSSLYSSLLLMYFANPWKYGKETYIKAS